jgi:cytochrome c-type biogenesis protein CcmH/NrfG
MDEQEARAARVEALRALLAEDDADVTTRFMLATELARMDLHGEAAAHFGCILDGDPDYTAAYRGLGRALMALGDTGRAREVFTAGLAVAERTGDMQSGREMASFLRRLDAEGGGS